MPLEDYLFNDKEKEFDVICVDETSKATEITKGFVYKVLGFLQSFFLLVNDKGILGKYYRDRFVVKDEEEE